MHEQCDGLHHVRGVGLPPTTPQYPLLLHEPYVRLYPAQVIKQADLVLAMQLQGHAFTAEQKARNVDYYERRTVRDSSLSACTQAVMCAEVGHLRARARLRLRGRAGRPARPAPQHQRRPAHGVAGRRLDGAGRRASAACATTRACWPSTRSCPSGIARLRFRLRWRDMRLTVDVTHDDVTVHAAGRRRTRCSSCSTPARRWRWAPTHPSRSPLRPRRPLLPTPEQPPGRRPASRAPGQPTAGHADRS